MDATRTTEFISMLTCPKCADDDSLDIDGSSVRCRSCNRDYQITDEEILDLVVIDELDEETRREMEGNFYPGSDEELKIQVKEQNNDIWHGYHWKRLNWEIKQLSKMINDDPSDRYFVLGEGTARSLYLISKYVKFKTLYCSDISMSAIRQVPWRLADKDISVGLFTSDLAECPISKTKHEDIPVIITYALHHLPDMEECMEKMLQRNISRFYLIEPVTNKLLGKLARKNIAQRVEYSGVSPSRFDLNKLEELCEQYGYSIDIQTNWKLPVDYFNKYSRNSETLGKVILSLISLLSLVTRPFNFGNGAVIKIARID